MPSPNPKASPEIADHDPPPTPPKKPSPAAGFILIGLVGGLLYSVCGRNRAAEEPAASVPRPAQAQPPPAASPSPPPAPTPAAKTNTDVDLVIACRKLMKKSLRAPDQSKLPGWLDGTPDIATLRDGRRRWVESLKAMNPYGVLMRQIAVCTFDPKNEKLSVQIRDPTENDD